MNMVEKVAKALHKADVDCLGANWDDLARAAIEAMKEPTDEMVRASSRADNVIDAYELMISAALKE